MPNMNITYKMPHVSTKLYSYIYVYTVRNGENKAGWEEENVKCWIYPLWIFFSLFFFYFIFFYFLQAEEKKKRQRL